MKIIVCQDDLPTETCIEKYASIDTEAMGLNHHRDRLCLVQVKSIEDTIYLVQIDINKKPAPNLIKILQNKHIVKICHYARFDIGLLYHTFNVMANNIYCTKIASRLVRTYSDKHGLKELCRQLLGIEITKGQQASDWGASVLTKDQQMYAASDVLHLYDLKLALDSILERESRTKLFQECCEFLPIRIKLDLMGWSEQDIFAHH